MCLIDFFHIFFLSWIIIFDKVSSAYDTKIFLHYVNFIKDELVSRYKREVLQALTI